ncbi:MAG: hypothetical protein KC546_09330 [Anaerolineae bacterium]|nr:hypothetical protein [Anaerolineae bacterium]
MSSEPYLVMPPKPTGTSQFGDQFKNDTVTQLIFGAWLSWVIIVGVFLFIPDGSRPFDASTEAILMIGVILPTALALGIVVWRYQKNQRIVARLWADGQLVPGYVQGTRVERVGKGRAKFLYYRYSYGDLTYDRRESIGLFEDVNVKYGTVLLDPKNPKIHRFYH